MSIKVDNDQQVRKIPVGIPLIVLLAIILGCWVISATQTINRHYDQIDRQLAANQRLLQRTISFKNGSSPIVMPVQDPFRSSGRWIYTASGHPLPKDYAPQVLTELTVPHTVSRVPFKLQPEAASSLAELFKAAQKANQPLIAVSAYRSIAEQQALYDFRVSIVGEEATKAGTAQPGSSEHHTGLAIDINSYTPDCAVDAQACGLSPATADWLAKHAPKYGYIVRYPEGKLEVTGIGYEPWHLRYIGKDALALTKSGLSLDEFYSKVTAK